jgi:hypothetical protein
VLRKVDQNAAEPRLLVMQREASNTATDFLEEVKD